MRHRTGSSLTEPEFEVVPNSSEFDAAADRRGFIGWMGRLGLGVIGAVAGLLATAETASAHGIHVGCCHLSNTSSCSGSGSSYNCPSGTYKRAWHCCQTDGGYRMCGECIKNLAGCDINSCHQDYLSCFACHWTYKYPYGCFAPSS